MTNKEILKKALKKAMDNGYDPEDRVAYFQCEDEDGMALSESGNYLHSYETCVCAIKTGLYKNLQLLGVSDNYFQLIFSVNFAKAFWGKEMGVWNIGELGIRPRWEDELQQMVLEEEPLKYLEKFL